MMEQDQSIDIYESQPPVVHWRYTSSGSVYSCDVLDDESYIVGGSVWDRRHTPFTDVSRNAQGIVTKIHLREGVIFNDGQRTFPSMVNAVIPLGDTIFVGCKNGAEAFNVINHNMEKMYTNDDEYGNGVYNAAFHQQAERLFVTTRSGWLLRLNPSSLLVEKRMCLSGFASRLWSLAIDERGTIFAGDYHGRLYMVNSDMTNATVLDLPQYLDDDFPKLQKRYDPSVFGLVTFDNNRVAVSIRWGQIYLLEYERQKLHVVKTLTLPEEISDLGIIPDSEKILIGTRSGRLYQSDLLGQSSPKQLIAIPPSFQTDNAIWSIRHVQKNEHIVSFADGQVVSIGFDN